VCTKGQKQYRCDGAGNCNKFWQWVTTSCNPFSCSAGSCTNTCSATCGADLACDGKKPGDSCETGKTCDSSCRCVETTGVKGSIAGTVNDTANNTIAGANVSASGPSSGFALTDKNGYYSISNLNPGDYTVTASATGYNSQSKNASVSTGTTTTVNFVLTPVCDYDNVCDTGETQACSDCKTFVSISPTYTYPGQEVTITIYFNDSRFDVDKSDYDVKFDLFISNIPWNSTNGCDIGSKKLRSEMNCGCGMGGCRNKHGYYGSSEYWVDFVDGYAKITATCKIPTTIPMGSHTLKVIPVIYSSPTILTPAEAVFKVANPFEKILLDLEARVISFLRRVTGFFILK
jgi:hypothetical protein